MMGRAIPDEVLTVLGEAVVAGNVVRLTQQLPRPLYEQTNKVLEALGGTWDRKAKGHIFDEEAGPRLDEALLTGSYIRIKEDFGFFPTPQAVIVRLMIEAKVEPHHTCLEPSAGQGAIADVLAKVVPFTKLFLVELLRENHQVLVNKAYRVHHGDFLTFDPMACRWFDGVDRVVMNPPFAQQQDIDHVTKAFGFLKPGGRLVSVMSFGVMFRDNRKTVAFRELVEEHGWMEPFPDESFKVSGTGVRTVMVVLEK